MKGDLFEMKGDLFEMKGDLFGMKGDLFGMKGATAWSKALLIVRVPHKRNSVPEDVFSEQSFNGLKKNF